MACLVALLLRSVAIETGLWSTLMRLSQHICHAVNKGDRVVQLILERIATPEVVEVADLEATIRGAGGYGSTGIGAA